MTIKYHKDPEPIGIYRITFVSSGTTPWTTVAVRESDKTVLDRINEHVYSGEASYRRIILDLAAEHHVDEHSSDN